MATKKTLLRDNIYTDNYELSFVNDDGVLPDKISLINTDDDEGNNASIKWQFDFVSKTYVDNANNLQDIRMSGIETKNIEQDIRLDAAEAKNAEQDNRLDAAEAKNAEQDNRLSDVETLNMEQDTRLDAAEAKNVEQDNRLDSVEALNAEQERKLTEIIGVNGTQTGRLDAVEVKNDEQDDKLTELANTDVEHKNRLDTLTDGLQDLNNHIKADICRLVETDKQYAILLDDGIYHVSANVQIIRTSLSNMSIPVTGYLYVKTINSVKSNFMQLHNSDFNSKLFADVKASLVNNDLSLSVLTTRDNESISTLDLSDFTTILISKLTDDTTSNSNIELLLAQTIHEPASVENSRFTITDCRIVKNNANRRIVQAFIMNVASAMPPGTYKVFSLNNEYKDLFLTSSVARVYVQNRVNDTKPLHLTAFYDKDNNGLFITTDNPHNITDDVSIFVELTTDLP